MAKAAVAQQPPAALFKDMADTAEDLVTTAEAAGAGEAPLPLPRQMLWVDRGRAEHYLKHVLRPRPVSWPDVDRYSRDMAAGRWRSRNSKSLTFSWPGVADWIDPECAAYDCAGRELMEGHQRMRAILKAIEERGLPGLWLEFAFNADPGDMGTIDTGRSRSDRDRTHIMGGGQVPDGGYSVARKIVAWTLREGAPVYRFSASQDELDDVLKNHGQTITAAMTWAAEASRNTKLAPSLLGFGYWLLHSTDPEVAEGFLADIGGRGANLPETSVALLFRRRAADELDASTRRGAKFEYMLLALLCTAWNCHVTLIDNARARTAAQRAGRRPPKILPPFKKLQLPAGKLEQANFPMPRRPRELAE